MKLTISKSKNAEQLYICKSVRINKNKTTSQIVKKLGTMESLLPLHDNDREKVIAWGKEQARIMTAAEKEENLSIIVEFSEAKKLQLGEKLRFNTGYLFLQKIYHQLGLHTICKEIVDNCRAEYDLSAILSRLIYARILAPSSKLSSYEFSKELIQQPDFELHQIYRALSLLAENSDSIQEAIYTNSKKLIDRNTSILYYDCTNYFFEIEEESGDRRYGKSKEHRPNPIIQMGLFLDGNGLPLAFTMFPGNDNEQPTLKPLEQKIIRDFNLSHFIVCTDAGLASTDNRKFNNINNRSFIVTQSLKVMKKYLKTWSLDPEGWSVSGSSDIYSLNEIDLEKHKKTTFYKERWINENGLEQRLIVTFSPKFYAYEKTIKEKQLERAEEIVSKGTSAETRNPNSPKRFIEEFSVTKDGEVAEKTIRSLDEEQFREEMKYAGFYAVCTTLDDPIETILSINKQRWQIEDAFRTMKTEFKARPVYLQRDDRIEAHFLTCFLSLLIIKILEKKLKDNYSLDDLLKALKDMEMHKLNNLGYLSSYERTEITDALHEVYNLKTDSEFISAKTMKKNLKESMRP